MWGRIELLTLAGAMAVGIGVIGAPALADDVASPTSVEETETPVLTAKPASEPEQISLTESAPAEDITATTTAVNVSSRTLPATVMPAGVVVAAAIAGLGFTPTDPLPGGAITASGTGCDPSENVLIRTFSTSLGADTYIDAIAPASADGSFSIPTRVWGAPGDPTGAAGGETIGVAAYCGGVETTDPDRRQIVFGTMATPVDGPVPPVAAPDSANTPYETAVTIDVLANDTGDDLQVIAGTNGADGDVVWAADGSSITYTPHAGFSGTDTFTYVVRDSARLQSNSTVSVTVAAEVPNELPIAVADSYATAYESPTEVSAPGLLANDTDGDGDALTSHEFTGPSHGTLSNFLEDGSFTYTPDAGFRGTDTFVYYAFDGAGTSADTTVSITVGDTTDGTAGSDAGDDGDDRALPDTGGGSAWIALTALIVLGAGSVAMRFGRIRT